MRALILLLACMNLGVAIWWASHRDSIAPVAPAAEPGIPTLVLLGETEHQPSLSDAAELSAAPEALAPNALCLSLGPFATPAHLRAAMNVLLPRVERIQFREVVAMSLRGYRVFLPAAGNRAEALATARDLSARRISDYYVVTAGDQQNTVSLGIFSELDNATRRHDEVAALGYDPTIEPRTEQVPEWWIDLAAAPGFEWRPLLTEASLKSVSAPCT